MGYLEYSAGYYEHDDFVVDRVAMDSISAAETVRYRELMGIKDVRSYRVGVEVIGKKVVVKRKRDAVVQCKKERGQFALDLTDRQVEFNNRANLKRSCSRSYRRVVDICDGMGADRMMTLTFQENIVDIDLVLMVWKEFLRLAHVRWGDFSYVCVPEKQKRGAIHFHVALNKYFYWFSVLQVWKKAVAVVSGMTGGIDIRASKKGRGNKQGIARYIAKYVSKAFYCADNCENVGRKRYYSNVSIREAEYVIGNDIDDVFIDNFVLDSEFNMCEICLDSVLSNVLGSIVEKVKRDWCFWSKYCGLSYRLSGYLV